MQDHYQAQVEAIADALHELMCEGPQIAQKGLVEAVEGWYDYYHREMLKWKALAETIKSNPSLTGSMEMK